MTFNFKWSLKGPFPRSRERPRLIGAPPRNPVTISRDFSVRDSEKITFSIMRYELHSPTMLRDKSQNFEAQNSKKPYYQKGVPSYPRFSIWEYFKVLRTTTITPSATTRDAASSAKMLLASGSSDSSYGNSEVEIWSCLTNFQSPTSHTTAL